MDFRNDEPGRDVKSLKDICLDSLAGCVEAEWFRDVWLPRALADRLYLKLQKRQLINDQAVPVVLHAESLVADLAGCPITDSGLLSLKPCTRIRKLSLSSTAGGYSFSEKNLLECFEQFHELNWLELVGISAVTLSVVELIAKQNERLTVLKLKKCENVTDSCLEVLGLHCHLQSVDFSLTQISSHGIAALVSGGCKGTLKEFIADQCMNIDHDALQMVVTNCLNLQILSLVGCPSIIGFLLKHSYWERQKMMRGFARSFQPTTSLNFHQSQDVGSVLSEIRQRRQLSWFVPC